MQVGSASHSPTCCSCSFSLGCGCSLCFWASSKFCQFESISVSEILSQTKRRQYENMFLSTLCCSSFRKSFGCGTKKSGDGEAYQVIKDEYKKLGKMSFAEGCVLTNFTLLVLLWFTREPGFIPGWATVLFNKDKP